MLLSPRKLLVMEKLVENFTGVSFSGCGAKLFLLRKGATILINWHLHNLLTANKSVILTEHALL